MFIKNEDFKIAHKLILKHDTIVIFGHTLPDGDCYGSQIGLRDTLRINFPNKKVYAVGSGLPSLFFRLGAMDVVEDQIIKESLAILVDVSDFALVEDQRINLAKEYLKIDHHYESKPFPYAKVMKTNKIATAEIIAEFIATYKLKMNKTIAEALYLGIATDSGRFLYEPTNKSTFLTTANLYDYQIEPKELFNVIYEVEENYLKYRGYLLSNYQKSPHGVIYCYVKKEVYLNLGLSYAYASSQVNTYSNIKGYPIFALFTENLEGGMRVELRSNTVPIREVALKYGGGGHALAAGVRMLKGSEQEINKIVQDLDQLLKE
ncbi:MAG: bifunctional oligoribonuclease/PAP phosphatase NrnA [Bacilli bacterium]|jgi:phosphoesterase RecJ-like protein|nr:bifunctional oligoribonuclease/PAP phosphatase NrnA [Bacilli bacterium]NLN80390.1 bifunctional oligoribonuclease/PAP phosphatase NrnA [Erysipelotrichia bacterium]